MEAILQLLTENFGFDLKLGLFSIINFFLIFLILNKFLFKKLSTSLDERKNKIEKGLDNFEKAQQELEKAKFQAEKVIESAKDEAGKIIEASYKEAQEVSDKIKTNTQAEVNIMLEKANKNISQLKVEMLVDLRKETVDLVVMTLEKIFDKNIPETVNKDLIKQSISDLSKK